MALSNNILTLIGQGQGSLVTFFAGKVLNGITAQQVMAYPYVGYELKNNSVLLAGVSDAGIIQLSAFDDLGLTKLNDSIQITSKMFIAGLMALFADMDLQDLALKNQNIYFDPATAPNKIIYLESVE